MSNQNLNFGQRILTPFESKIDDLLDILAKNV